MKTRFRCIIFLLTVSVGPLWAQGGDEKPVSGKKLDPRVLNNASTPLEARFPDGLGPLRRENVELVRDGIAALNFQRFVADRPGEMSAEISLIPIGKRKDFRTNPRRRLRAMADLMGQDKKSRNRSEAWFWHRGFPALRIRFQVATVSPKKSDSKPDSVSHHRVDLIHYPQGVAFLQVITSIADGQDRGDVASFFAKHRHRSAKAPADFVFESPGARLNYCAETTFDALDGILRLGGKQGRWGLAVTEFETRSTLSPLEELATILAEAIASRGALKVIKGPECVDPGPKGVTRHRLDYLEPQAGGPPIHRVFIYLQCNKTRTLLSAFSPTMIVERTGRRPYYRLAPGLVVPLGTFERLNATPKEDG
ncbi:MAG: hypothetical protein V3W41_17700 [Planctomycetota bacterium]